MSFLFEGFIRRVPLPVRRQEALERGWGEAANNFFRYKFYPMNKNKNSISRKDALKRMGGLSFGLPFIPSILANLPLDGKKKNRPISKAKKIKGKPNILWITAEGVPLSVLSCYGSKLMQTPNIDRIANTGSPVKFWPRNTYN